MKLNHILAAAVLGALGTPSVQSQSLSLTFGAPLGQLTRTSTWKGMPTGYTGKQFTGTSIPLSDNMPRISGKIRSIRLPAGQRITIFSGANYTGSKYSFTGTWNPDDRDWWVGRVNSLRIEDVTGSGGSQPGWIGQDPAGYTQRGYRGNAIRLTRNYPDLSTQLLSIRVPKGQRVMFYSDENYRGNTFVVDKDWSAGSNDWWAGRIRSLRILDNDGSQPPSNLRDPVLFSGRNYTGNSEQIRGDWRGSNAWDGPTYVYSIRVPAGQRIIVYSEPNFRGRTKEITGSWSIPRGDFWEKRVRSVRAYNDSLRPPGGGDDNWGGGHGNSSNELPTMYGEPNFTGNGLPFNRDWSGFDLGNGPKNIRSISVPRGWRLILYSQPRYQGQSLRITSNFSPASGSFWTENVRSIKVYGPGQR